MRRVYHVISISSRLNPPETVYPSLSPVSVSHLTSSNLLSSLLTLVSSRLHLHVHLGSFPFYHICVFSICICVLHVHLHVHPCLYPYLPTYIDASISIYISVSLSFFLFFFPCFFPSSSSFGNTRKCMHFCSIEERGI